MQVRVFQDRLEEVQPHEVLRLDDGDHA
jgi:hypothetical protein